MKCPECGQSVPDTPYDTLRSYVKRQLDAKQRALKVKVRGRAEDLELIQNGRLSTMSEHKKSRRIENNDKWVKQAKDLVAKWQGWLDLLDGFGEVASDDPDSGPKGP